MARTRKAPTPGIPIAPPPALTIRTEKLDGRGWVNVGAQTDLGGVSIVLTRPLGDEWDANNPYVTAHAHFLGVGDHFDAAPSAHGAGLLLSTEVNAMEDFARCLLDVVALARAGGVIPSAEVQS